MKLTNWIIIIIIGTISFYTILLVVSDFAIISDKISQFEFQYLPIILILIPCGWMFLFLRWILLLRNSNIFLPFKENFLIYFSGFAFAITPAKFGELIKSQIMKNKFNVPRKSTASLVLVERLYDLLGAVAVSFLGIWFLGTGIYIIIIASIFLVLAFLMISSRKVFTFLLSVFGKIKFTAKLIKPLADSYEIIRQSSRGKIAFLASLCTAIFWLIESLGVYFILIALGIDSLSYVNIVSTYTSSLILGAASFIPGGIGVAEGSLIGLLNYQGIELSEALIVVVLIRIFTLWYSVIAGFIALKIGGGLGIRS